MAVFVEDEGFARLLQYRVLVAGVGGGEFAGGDLQDAEPDGHEHLLAVVGADGGVDVRQDLGGGLAGQGVVRQKDLGGHHEERCGDAFAGYVGHDQAQMVVIHKEEVVEITADSPGRVHAGVDLKFGPVRKCRESIRKHVRLDPGGEGQLVADAFALCFFEVPGFQELHLAAGVQPHERADRRDAGEEDGELEPELFVQGLLLDDGDRQDFALSSEGILELHDEAVAAAGKIRVGHGIEIAAVHGHGLLVKSIQVIGDLRVREGVVVHEAVDGQPCHVVGEAEGACFIRVDAHAVGVDEGDGLLEVGDVLQGGLDVDLRDAGGACDVEIPFRRQLAVGVEGHGAGQAVGQTVVDRMEVAAGEELLRGKQVDAVAAEDPDIAAAVLVQVGVVGIGEVRDRGDLVVLGHVGDGVAGDDPVKVSRCVIFDVHDDARPQACVGVDVAHAALIDDIDAAAVGAEKGVPVRRGADAEAHRVGEAVVLSEGGDDAVAFDHVHAACAGDEDLTVGRLADGADPVGEETVFLREGQQTAGVVAQQTALVPGGDPQSAAAVRDDGADPHAIQMLQKIGDFLLRAGGGHCGGHRDGRHRAVLLQD